MAALVETGARRSGYELVPAPEGVPTVSVNYLALLGPACLWLGAALLVSWLADTLLARGRPAWRAWHHPPPGRSRRPSPVS